MSTEVDELKVTMERFEGKLDNLTSKVHDLDKTISTGKSTVKIMGWLGSIIVGLVTVFYMVISAFETLRHPH